MKIINKIGFVLAGLFFALVFSVLPILAAEDQTSSYTFNLSGSSNDHVFDSKEIVVMGGDVKFYSFRIENTGGIVLYAFSPSSFSYSVDSGSSISVFTSVSIGDSKVYYKQLYSMTSSNDSVYVGFPNLNIVSGHFPNIKDIAEEMAAAGFYDYDDSEWATDREQYNYFSLSGFQCDDSISASWSGVLTDSQLIKNHVDDVEVVVSPSFLLILDPGESYEKFKEPESLVLPLSGNFKRSYDSFFDGNPYKGRALLTLDFYPRYYDSATGNMYRGDSISVRFDSKGKITDIDLPESSLIPVYDPGCYFDSPASTTITIPGSLWKTFFRWNKVVTSYVYKSNYIAVDIGYDGNWYPYSNDDFFSSTSLSLTFDQVAVFVTDLVPDAVLSGYKLRFTPYYKTSAGSYYGKPIVVSVSNDGKSESITEVDGDYLDDTKLPDYIDKTPTDWFDDSTLWDNVEHVTDHIKDDLDGTVDLDNLSFNFFKMLKSVINACGQFPALVATVFSFLPADISRLLVISLSLIIIMRILGR